MAKEIELTIKTSYLPNWGAYEGIRELVQNARDAEIEYHASLKIDHYNDTLRIENEGTTIPVKALLLGHTTKLYNSDLIGKFGEGLKLGVLALVRAGHKVKIRNGSEVWTPFLKRSSTFDEEILAFTIETGRKSQERVRVEISGISLLDWGKMQQGFLFLHPPKKKVSTSYGELLQDPEHVGKIYVKGIFVQNFPELQFGYNFFEADLDRDRKMVESYNIKWMTRSILMQALRNEDMELLNKFQKMLEEGTPEVEDITSYTDIPEVAAKHIAKCFEEKYGEDAVPVDSLATSKDIEHLGRKGIIVNKPYANVLAKTLGDITSVQENLKKEVVSYYNWHDLSPQEKSLLEEAVELSELSLDTIDIVEFRSSNLLGQFKDNRILISKNILNSFEETLATLIHEASHQAGLDGDKDHVSQIEERWKRVVFLLKRKNLN